MGRSLITSQLKTYKKKRDLNLFFLLGALVFTIIVFILLNLSGVNFDFIVTIMLILVIILTVMVVFIRPKILTFNMYYKYFLMLDDSMGVRSSNHIPFTKSFDKKLADNDFDKKMQTSNFVVHYKVVKGVKEVRIKGRTLIAVVLAKHPHSDFYGEELQQAFLNIQEKEKKFMRKQIVLQFQKYETFNQSVKESIDQVINLVDGANAVVHITCGMMLDTNNIYYLRPNTKFPNRYYYYASHLIESMLEID